MEGETPVPLFGTPAWIALGAFLLSGCLSYRVTRIVDGRTAIDIDYVAAPLGLVATGLALYAAGRAGELDDSRRVTRMALLYGLAGLAALRTWSAVAFWPF